jgi:Fe-S cluster biogenesis protein NfuA
MVDVRAYAQSHGGNIDLVSVTETGTVTIRFSGACKGCPLSGITLKLGIEEQLRIRVPGVRKVVAG